MKSKNLIFLYIFPVVMMNLVGCEALIKKFVRKPKEAKPAEEMVLAPEEYTGPQMTQEELYRQYFLFWKSWQGELIEALTSGANHKKLVGCIKEAINNLEKLRTLLAPEKQPALDAYLTKMKEIEGSITSDIYGNNANQNRENAERLRRNILRDFSYQKVKGSLI